MSPLPGWTGVLAERAARDRALREHDEFRADLGHMRAMADDIHARCIIDGLTIQAPPVTAEFGWPADEAAQMLAAWKENSRKESL